MDILEYFLKKLSKLLIHKSIKWQMESRLRDPSLWDIEVNSKGHLSVGGIDTIELVERHGSPLMVVNKKKLLSDAKNAINAFKIAPQGSKILYSYKTNGIPGIIKELHDLGIGAEVISPYELWLAERLGVKGDMIVYNGVNKTEESLNRAIKMDVLSINIDSFEEIDLLCRIAKRLNKRANVGIRLGLVAKSQFGLEIESGEAMDACEKIAALSRHLNLQCVHFNVTSNERSASTHKYYSDKALNFISKLKAKRGIAISYLDIGGGFGVETTKNMSGYEYGLYRLFGCLPKPPSPDDYQPVDSFFSDIIENIRQSCERLNLDVPKIIIEPGRLVTSRSEFLLASVNSIKNKNNGTIFAITDAGRLSMTFPCDFEYHEVFVANRPNDKLDEVYQVMGRICTSADWMFKNRCLPELKAGDILAVMDAGAYFSSYSSNFAFPRPAIVMIDDGKARVIREQETFEHLTAMDVFNEKRQDNRRILQ